MGAEFRSVQTRMWREDEWFQDLPTDARLLFIYLFTNPSASVSGIYRLPLRTIEFESGIPGERVKELLEQFAAAHKVYFEDGTIWVVKMHENQLPAKHTLSKPIETHLTKEVAKIPPGAVKDMYLRHYGYPIDTLSVPYGGTDTDTDTDTETDTETRTAQADSPTGKRTEQDETKAIAAKLESVGVALSTYIVDTYMAACLDYGIHAVLSGITAAAETGNQQKSSYVLACIRNKASGYRANGTGRPEVQSPVPTNIAELLK